MQCKHFNLHEVHLRSAGFGLHPFTVHTQHGFFPDGQNFPVDTQQSSDGTYWVAAGCATDAFSVTSIGLCSHTQPPCTLSWGKDTIQHPACPSDIVVMWKYSYSNEVQLIALATPYNLACVVSNKNRKGLPTKQIADNQGKRCQTLWALLA